MRVPPIARAHQLAQSRAVGVRRDKGQCVVKPADVVHDVACRCICSRVAFIPGCSRASVHPEQDRYDGSEIECNDCAHVERFLACGVGCVERTELVVARDWADREE